MASAAPAAAAPTVEKKEEEEVGLDVDLDVDERLKKPENVNRLITVVFNEVTKPNRSKTIQIPAGFLLAECVMFEKTYENLLKENEQLASEGKPLKPWTFTLECSDFLYCMKNNVDVEKAKELIHCLQWSVIDHIETYWRIHAGIHPRVLWARDVKREEEDQKLAELAKTNPEVPQRKPAPPKGCVPHPIRNKTMVKNVLDPRDGPFIEGGKVTITNNDGTTQEIDWPGIRAYGLRLGLVHELADSANYLGMVPLTYLAVATNSTNILGNYDKKLLALINAEATDEVKADMADQRTYEYIYTKGDGLIEENEHVPEEEEDDEEEEEEDDDDDDDDDGEEKKADDHAGAAAAAGAPGDHADDADDRDDGPAAGAAGDHAPAGAAGPTLAATAPTTQEDEDAQLAAALQASQANDPENVD